MQIDFAAIATAGSGALVLGALEGGGWTAPAQDVDRALGGALKRAQSVTRFSGKIGQVVELLAPEGLSASRILLVGLGKPKDIDASAAERIGASVVGRLLASGEKEVVFALGLPKGGGLKSHAFSAPLGLGAKLRSYRFDRYRTKKIEEQEPTLTKVTVGTPDVAAARRDWSELDAVANGICLARDLVNEPPNVLSPQEFANRAKALAKLGVKVEVLGEAQMKKLGMGALLGVGQGSDRESQLVVMQWNGARGKKDTPVAFVGKGVCFDSGGLSLKTGAGMMGMKGDMGGAAAVVGTMHGLAGRKGRVQA